MLLCTHFNVFLPPALMWDHKESVLRTVENDGLLLQYVVSWLRKDPEIVMAAVTNNGIAMAIFVLDPALVLSTWQKIVPWIMWQSLPTRCPSK